MIHGHGGNIYALADRLGCRAEDILDLSSNVNPLGPPPGLTHHLKATLPSIARLPEADARGMVRAFSAFYKVPASSVLAGNGTTQLLHQIPRALGTRRALIAGPTYADYRDACATEGAEWRFHLAGEDQDFAVDLDALVRAAETCDTVFICNPNNPTGQLISGDRLQALCQRLPDKRFVIDESYLPFVPGGESASLMASPPENAIVLHSMSKIFRVPGLRIGFAVAKTPWIEKLARFAMPWSVNSLAQAAVIHLLSQSEATVDFIENSRKLLAEEIDALRRTLVRSVPGLIVYPTVTSFVLIRLPGRWTAGRVWNALAEQGMLIRDCSNFEGLSERFIRISVQTPEVNRKAAAALVRLLGTR